MPKLDYCAQCVAERIREHGKFDHAKGLSPAVTTINGTRFCGVHGETALRKIRLARAMADDHTALSTIEAVLDSPAFNRDDFDTRR